MAVLPLKHVADIETVLENVEHVLHLQQCEDIAIENRFMICSVRHEVARALFAIQDPVSGLRAQLSSTALSEPLPDGIKQDIEHTQQENGLFQPLVAIRHWIEIADSDSTSVSHWTCDGYASSLQGAIVVADALHKSSRYNYEVWSLHPFKWSKRPHILAFVPDINTNIATFQSRRRGVTEQEVMRFSVQWCIKHYGIDDSNYRYIKALVCKPPSHNGIWECTVQFSQSGERVTCLLHNLPPGLKVFSLRYGAERE